MKILLVPHDAGNFAPLMAKRLREQGYDAKCIIFAQSYLSYAVQSPDKLIGGRGIWALLMLELKRWLVLYEALSYDVIVFTFGSTILPNPAFIGWGLSSKISLKMRLFYTCIVYPFSYFMLDVWLFHKLHKHIAVLFQGGDARRGDVLKARGYPDIDEEPKGYYVAFVDKLKQRRAKLWDKYADVIWYHNPDLYWALPERATFMPYPIETNEETQI